jgi:hypothetical protein
LAVGEEPLERRLTLAEEATRITTTGNRTGTGTNPMG